MPAVTAGARQQHPTLLLQQSHLQQPQPSMSCVSASVTMTLMLQQMVVWLLRRFSPAAATSHRAQQQQQ
jgi:hypothetical protein